MSTAADPPVRDVADVDRPDRRPVGALLAANAVSQIGNMMTSVAVPWFVLETTGSAAQTGLAAAAIALGAVLPAVLGGPMVDRLGFKRASVFGDLLSSLTVAAVPLLHLVGVLEFWHLLVLVFLLSSFNAQGDTARYALVPALATRAAMGMERANAADRAVARLGQLVGPVLAGLLIVGVGASNVLFVDAGTFLASALLILIGVPARAAPRTDADDATYRRDYFGELLAGLRFVVGNRLILSMVLIATIGNLLDIPLLTVIIPVYAREIFGSPTSLGLVLGAFAGGALLGTILFGAVGERLPRRGTLLTSWTLAPLLAYGVLALQAPLAVVVVVGLMAGIVAGPINPILLTVVQENTPPEMRGRVFGALSALAQAGIPVGAALAGFVVEAAGVIPTITGMAVVYLLFMVAMAFNPALHRMRRREVRRQAA